MSKKKFSRDELARFYAQRHLQTDPGTRIVYYLPKGAPAREIRLVEVNELIVERQAAPAEPLDMGVDRWGSDAHKLLVVDVTPSQWDRIKKKELALPETWNLEGAISISR